METNSVDDNHMHLEPDEIVLMGLLILFILYLLGVI